MRLPAGDRARNTAITTIAPATARGSAALIPNSTNPSQPPATAPAIPTMLSPRRPISARSHYATGEPTRDESQDDPCEYAHCSLFVLNSLRLRECERLLT